MIMLYLIKSPSTYQCCFTAALVFICGLSACTKKPESSALDNVHTANAVKPLVLGNLSACETYNGTPVDWLKSETAGMQLIKQGRFNIGSTQGYPDELPLNSKQALNIPAFWIDQTEVTNAQFASFVKATAYVTDAEKQGGGAVFIAPKEGESIRPNSWWHFIKGATWQHPIGPDSDIHGKENRPVILLTKNDAEHYATWLGHDLPTEAQWEYAARLDENATESAHAPHDGQHQPAANYWQGEFPLKNDKTDHFAGVAPVGCFNANKTGLYDMIGNVWEWTQTAYSGSHEDHQYDAHQDHQQDHGGDPSQVKRQSNAFNSNQPYTIKGGSYLCAANYCVRYRATARYPQEADLATNHVGFRTVLNIK